ncbi:N-acetyltransferase O1 (Establishment of cohesion protein 1) [Agyrium rufum]|nr:N-acetyltransferase O1 (Establishment of cohesion protein 1) [Agyrium rufum]
MPKTYAGARNRRFLDLEELDGFDQNDYLPRKRIRMGPSGRIVEEEFGEENVALQPLPIQPVSAVLSSSITTTATVPAKSEPRPQQVSLKTGYEDDDSPLSSDASDDALTTPPSSPPTRLSSPPPQIKSAFASLKRKRSLSTQVNNSAFARPLHEIPNPNTTTNLPLTKTTSKPKKLTQTHLDLGQSDIRRTCRDCGMAYVPSHAEDVALHKEFHGMHTRGVDFGRALLKDVVYCKLVSEKESILCVDARSSLALRKRVQRVLDLVAQDLGSVEIAEEELWGGMLVQEDEGRKQAQPPPRKTARRGTSGVTEKEVEVEKRREDRFKVFLYLVDERCVGLCLAERIHTAARVVEPEASSSLRKGHTPHSQTSQIPKQQEKTADSSQVVAPSIRSSSISISTDKDAALLGISRIWVSKSSRQKGMASRLLDAARGSFFYGIQVPKEMVAFSQPSESGTYLAEGWFGKESGWHVYEEGS